MISHQAGHGSLEPLEVLRAVRKGYALATPPQIELVEECIDLEILEGGWVPRWALEALDLLEAAECTPVEIRGLFAQGHAAIKSELDSLVQQKRLVHPIELRRPYERLPIDLPTEMALKEALHNHRTVCTQCKFTKPCGQGADLEDELDLLFPKDRRMHARDWQAQGTTESDKIGGAA